MINLQYLHIHGHVAVGLTHKFFDGSRIILQILAASLTTHHFKIKNRYHTVIPVTSGHNPIGAEGQLESQIIIFNAGPSSIEAQLWMDWKGKGRQSTKVIWFSYSYVVLWLR